MKLIKTSHQNEFKMEGLTLGKLLAIRNALQEEERGHRLGPVGQDVLHFLEYENLERIEEFE